MTTCRDCIHYDVCHNNFKNIDLNEEMTDEHCCVYFKDKSRIIELSCKVGDTVYYIANIGKTSRLLPFINEYSVLTIRHSKRTIYFDLCNKNEKHKNEKVVLTVSMNNFGKNWFTSKLEAEKELKEEKERELLK